MGRSTIHKDIIHQTRKSTWETSMDRYTDQGWTNDFDFLAKLAFFFFFYSCWYKAILKLRSLPLWLSLQSLQGHSGDTNCARNHWHLWPAELKQSQKTKLETELKMTSYFQNRPRFDKLNQKQGDYCRHEPYQRLTSYFKVKKPPLQREKKKTRRLRAKQEFIVNGSQ